MSTSIANPWTVAHQAPLSLQFPRQEYYSGLPSPSPGDLPNPGIVKSVSPALAGGFLTTELPGKPIKISSTLKKKDNDLFEISGIFFCDLGNIMIPCKEFVNGLCKLFVC